MKEFNTYSLRKKKEERKMYKVFLGKEEKKIR